MNLTKLLVLTSCRIFIYIWYCVISSYCAQYSFTTQPHSVLVAEGKEASLTCEWEPPLSEGHIVRWYHWPNSGGTIVDVTSDTNYNVYTDTSSSGQRISRLMIKRVGYNTGSGKYRCEIGYPNDPLFSEYASVGTIKCFPENYNGEIGHSIACSTSSSGIDLSWYTNKTNLIDTTTKNGVLYTYPLDRGDDGVSFTCKARSRGPESTEIGTCETTPLVLRIDTRIEKSPPGSLQVGGNFNLTCLTRGDPNNYEYRWKISNRFLDLPEDYEGKRYGIGENPYVFTFRDVQSGFNGTVIRCIVRRGDREDSIATYTIDLHTLRTTTYTKYTNQFDLTPTLPNSRSTKHEVYTTVFTGRKEDPASSQTTIIVVGIVAITLTIFITILIICFLSRRRKTKSGDVKKLEHVPLEEPTYDDIKEKDNDNKINNSVFETGKLLTNLTIYDEPTISNSNIKLDQPVNGPASTEGDDDQLASSRTDKYDTPRKAVSLDHLDTHNTISVEEANAMYATPTKTRSRESIDAMYAKPNKTHSKESIDDLYSKPNKSAGNTPKLEHNAKKNVEGLTYADIEFQNGDYPAPTPKDYGLDYASVQFSN